MAKHEHMEPTGCRACGAERYPAKLLVAMFKGVKEQLCWKKDGVGSLSALDVGVHVDEAEPSLSDFSWQDSTKDKFFDERTGFALDNELVKQGRRIEMGYMGQLKVWDAVPLQECWDNTGRAPIGTRWVDTDKGDADHPDVRCRIIVQETRNSSTIDKGDIAATFAATPPLECLRIICSVVMSQPKEKNTC